MKTLKIIQCLFRPAIAFSALGIFCAPLQTAAQAFPSKPIEIVVHTAAGGGTDVIARAVADMLTREKLITQPINVTNRPGGGGAIAYNYLKSKRGDPHVIMSVASLALLTQTLRPELGLGLEHYAPVAFLAQDPQAVIVASESPYKTLKDLIDASKRDPNSLVASITSPGGSGRLLVWLMEKEIGVRARTVSFKGGADAIMQVMGGHTQFTTENISEGYSAVQAKKLRVLAVTSAQRMSIVPDAPTFKELGFNIHMGTGRGFAMPAGVPKEAVVFLEQALEKVYKSAAWKDFSEKNMYENLWMGSADYTKHLNERRALMVEFMQSIGLTQKP